MTVSRGTNGRSPTVSNRWERRREEILERAIKLFARDGYADLDLQILADDLGIGKGTLYRYFGSKQDLFLAAADRAMHNLRQYIETSLAGIEEPLERITAAIQAYLRYFRDHPEAVEMLIQERAQFKDRKQPTYFQHREAHRERWRTLYRDLIAQGRIRPIPVERILDVIGDLLYGTMFVSYVAGRNRPPEEMAADIIDIVFHGILSDAERQRRLTKTAGPAHD
ncbi:MAG TPA: TetR/AcrR family transcriptional regulator [Gemmataceae bacterium]|nr:TetR/AcrR family transcriptional regulator [Gemmataceae bacterium]